MTSLSITPVVFDLTALSEIWKDPEEIMVYGWKHCHYDKVGEALDALIGAPNYPIKKVHSYRIGDPFDSTAKTIAGRRLNHLFFSGSEYLLQHQAPPPKVQKQVIGRECKTAITNIVLENYKRKKEGKPLIPILFCIDIDGNPSPARFDRLAAKHPKFNNQITYKELRRAYKLCTHENPSIREVALETFKFIKLTKNRDGGYAPKSIAAPWAHSLFSTMWDMRKMVSKSQPKKAYVNWREQLDERIKDYDKFNPVQVKAATSDTSGTKRKADDEKSADSPKKAHVETADSDVIMTPEAT